ncbi:MAG TPA: GatB/YqeY domain-containing protein [Candidatus Mailhella excrementigallinarum]|nr:MAG: glutamyl-tRNA amidotransferase [Desulfovibrionaceae bacterium]HIV64979.1 GatB/YqeY domain-containing protein [Candidatus Mailhella excrementigallinarum]
MSTAERIEKDYLDAYKAKDKVRLGTLRLLKTAAKNLQVELMRPLTDADYMDVLLKQAKQRQDSIEQYAAANRSDLAEQEAAELAVLREYLPQPLTEEELLDVVEKTVKPLLGEGMKAMGKAIQAIMAEYRGRVDGKAVSDAVKVRFQKG